MTHQTVEHVQDLLHHALRQYDDATLDTLAAQLGYSSSNLLRAFISGDLRVPLDKAFMLADHLGQDRAEFFTACMKQYLREDTFQQFVDAFRRQEPSV